jgi:spore germination protein YaaH
MNKQLFPNFISSQSLRGLRSLMAQVSLRRGGTVNFFSVYYDQATKNHVAWFHDDMESVQASEYNLIKDLKQDEKQ